jgi:hypothetical protein
MLACDENVEQCREGVLFAKRGRVGRVAPGARGTGVFGLEEVGDASALAAAEFTFNAGDAGKPKIYQSSSTRMLRGWMSE